MKTFPAAYQWQITTNRLKWACHAINVIIDRGFILATKSIPRGNDFIDEGLPHYLHSASDYIHIDSSLYFQYIKHVEPHLSKTRPVVILQDNLMTHDDYDIVELCLDRKIHLVNFPTKTRHMLQPLDNIFGSLQNPIQNKAREAYLFSQIGISRSKIPILLRFGIYAMRKDIISGISQQTG